MIGIMIEVNDYDYGRSLKMPKQRGKYFTNIFYMNEDIIYTDTLSWKIVGH